MTASSLGPKFVRMIAFDPMLFDGRRVHEAAGWYSPQNLLTDFIQALNWSAQEEIYQPEGGNASSAIWYAPTIPYQPISAQYGPFAQDPTFPVVHLEADEFVSRLATRGPWPYDGMEQGNAYLASILNSSYLGFDLVADANAGRFHLLIIYAPGGGSDEGGYHGLAESWMFHAADDPTGYGVNAGQFEPSGDSPPPEPQPPSPPEPQPPTPPEPSPQPPTPPEPPSPPTPGPDHRLLYSLPLRSGEGVGLRHDRKFVALYANATRAVDALLHSWGHAHIDNGVLGTIWDHDNKEVSSPLALWMQIDDASVVPIGHTDEAHCGDVHHLPNSYQGDYSYDDPDIVPSNASVWLDYPNRGPWAGGVLNLGNNGRRAPVGQFSWGNSPAPPLAPLNALSPDDASIDAFPSYVRSYVWRYRRLPRGEGKVDGRHADWWRYLIDVNEQAGRGAPVTAPTKQALFGVRDLTLTVLESNDARCRVGIFWRSSSIPSSTFPLMITGEPGHGAVTYEVLGGFGQERDNFEIELPPDGVPRYFVLIWQRPNVGGVLISDVLGVIPGTSSGAQPSHPSVSLLQGPIPYLRCGNPGAGYVLDFATVKEDNQILMFVPFKPSPAQASCCYADVWTTESRHAIGLTDTGGMILGRSDTLLVMRGWSQV